MGGTGDTDNIKNKESKTQALDLYRNAIKCRNPEILSNSNLTNDELLHFALKEKQLEITRHLLSLNADPKSLEVVTPGGQKQNIIFALLQDPNVEDEMAKGEAFATRGTIQEFLDLLYFSESSALDVGEKDVFGQTIQTMHYCQASDKIISYFLEKSWELVTKSEWSCTKSKNVFPLVESLEKMPRNIDEILRRLDDSITYEPDNHIDTNESKIIQDFKSLLPARDPSEINDAKSKKETELLHSLLECTTYVRDKLLGHPLVQSFVYLKAKRFKKFVWFAVIFYLILACLISLFVINIHLTKCKHIYKRDYELKLQRLRQTEGAVAEAEEIVARRISNHNTSDVSEDMQTDDVALLGATHTLDKQDSQPQSQSEKPEANVHKPKKERMIDNFKILLHPPELQPSASQNRYMKCRLGTQTKITQIVGVLMIVILGAKVLIKFIILAKVKRWKVWKEYFLPRSWKNWMDIYLIATATLSFTTPSMMTSSTGTYIQFQAAGCVVLITWSLLLLQLGKFQTQSVYIELFLKVLETFVYFLVTFGVLFIGFTLSATVLFTNNASFYTLPRSLLKVFAMATGELGYEEFFYKDIEDNEKVILRYPFLSHLFFIFFIVLVTLCLMNFLVALAVDGIEDAKAEAKTRSLTKTITNITHLEELFCSDVFLITWLPSCIRKSILLAPILPNKISGDGVSKPTKQDGGSGYCSCTQVDIDNDDSHQDNSPSSGPDINLELNFNFIYMPYHQRKLNTGFCQYVLELLSMCLGLDCAHEYDRLPQEIKDALADFIVRKGKN